MPAEAGGPSSPRRDCSPRSSTLPVTDHRPGRERGHGRINEPGDRDTALAAEAQQWRPNTDPIDADRTAEEMDQHAALLGTVDLDHKVGAMAVAGKAVAAHRAGSANSDRSIGGVSA